MKHNQKIALYLLLLSIVIEWNFVKPLRQKNNMITAQLNNHALPTYQPPTSKQTTPYATAELSAEINQLLLHSKLHTTQLNWIDHEQFSTYLNMETSGGYSNLQQFIEALLKKYPQLTIIRLSISRRDQAELSISLQLNF